MPEARKPTVTYAMKDRYTLAEWLAQPGSVGPINGRTNGNEHPAGVSHGARWLAPERQALRAEQIWEILQALHRC